MTRVYDPVTVARQFRYVREAKANSGARVGAIQAWSLGQDGDSWCCEFATMVLDICYQGDSPLPRMQSCQAVLDTARQRGWMVPTPEIGDLFLYVNGDGHAHHIGIVTKLAPLTGIAGNTSPSGASSNGDGVYEHPIDAALCVFVRVPA